MGNNIYKDATKGRYVTLESRDIGKKIASTKQSFRDQREGNSKLIIRQHWFPVNSIKISSLLNSRGWHLFGVWIFKIGNMFTWFTNQSNKGKQ